MRREIWSGLALGSILGSIGFLRISLWSAVLRSYGPHWLLVGDHGLVALVGVVLWGTLSGSMLPFVLRRLGLRPGGLLGALRGDAGRRHRTVIYFSVAA